jgi:hypothetical protein
MDDNNNVVKILSLEFDFGWTFEVIEGLVK